ncbi:MAG: hypothetical protein Q4Q07_02885 [Tissierellia bacterium]|nr:hypothetical protein [Tissierellia bacterium]
MMKTKYLDKYDFINLFEDILKLAIPEINKIYYEIYKEVKFEQVHIYFDNGQIISVNVTDNNLVMLMKDIINIL